MKKKKSKMTRQVTAMALAMGLIVTANAEFPSMLNVKAMTIDASLKTASISFPKFYPDTALKALSDAEIEKRVNALVKTMTQEEKFTFLGGNGTGLQGNAGSLPGVPRLGVPEIKMYDGPAGVLSLYDTTNPPIQQMLAATWDTDLAYLYGDIEGSENAAIGGNMQLGAQYDITRSPQFGRSKDQLGEDPYLLSALAVEETKGIQDNNVITCLKHYAAFSMDATPATNTNAVVSEQALHEIHLPGFEAAIKKGGAGAVMSSYNMINGVFASANTYLQLEVLRNEWNYQGLTVTDWGGNDGYTLNKGTDIEMPFLSKNTQSAAEEQIKKGTDTQETIDEAVSHVLTAMGEAGYLGLVKVDENGYAMEETGRTATIQLKADTTELAKERKQNSKSALKIAEEGGVLLKNVNNVLPLDTDNNKSVAVIGLGGMNLISGIGGERSYGTIADMVSPYEALCNEVGADKVEGQVAMDIVGTAIPSACLYTTNDANAVNGVTRSYGTGESTGSASDQQGQIKTAGSISKTKMGSFEIGTYASTDKMIDFTTGTIKGKPNKTYKNTGADSGTATAFTKESGVAYTWTTYIKAPESGEYSLILEGIGGSVAASIQTGVDAKGTATSKSLGISSINQGTQWPSDSIICTDTGMSISSTAVTMEAGKYYKVIVSGIASLSEKDLQVRLAWITPSQKNENYQKALKAAESNDTVVVFAYHKAQNIQKTLAATTCRLESSQEQLILDVAERAHKNGNKVVVVLNNDSAVTMSSWIDQVDGLLEMYYPGQCGGIATAELLTGKVNPSGKLAYTIQKEDTDTLVTYSSEAFARNTESVKGPEKPDSYYLAQGKMFGLTDINEIKARLASFGMDGMIHNINFDEGIMTGYRWYDENNVTPLYDFGYGLSYTTFNYSGLTVKSNTVDGEDVGADVTFTVTNTGSVEGSEIAQVYLGEADVPKGIQSAKYQLAGFARVDDLAPGESKQVTIHVTGRSLSYWNSNLSDDQLIVRADGTKDKWTVATGERMIYVGTSSDNLVMSREMTVDSKSIAVKTVTAPAKVTVEKVTNAKANSATITWDKVSGATGYEVSYSTSKKFTKSTTKTVDVTSNSHTLNNLTKGTTYYIRVKAYVTDNGTKVYSNNYSKVKAIKIKK